MHFSLLELHRSVGEVEAGVVGKTAGEPEEGLLEVVVALGGDVVVLEVLTTVEGDHLGLDLAVGGVDLVADEDDGDVVADAGDVAMPAGDVTVGLAGGDLEHDDGAVTLDVVAVTEAAEFFLAGGVPAVEADLTASGEEGEGVNVNTHGGDVALFEVTSEMALDKCRLARTTVAAENKLEEGDDILEGRRVMLILIINVVVAGHF